MGVLFTDLSEGDVLPELRLHFFRSEHRNHDNVSAQLEEISTIPMNTPLMNKPPCFATFLRFP